MDDFFHSKISKIISTLNLEEWKSFKKWLHSPWSNSNKKLVLFYDYLQKYYPDFQKLDKKKLFHKLYPQQTYTTKRMSNLMSELSLQLEDFLVHQRLRRDQEQKNEFLMDEYLERHRKDWFFKLANISLDQKNQKQLKSSSDYLHLSLLNEKIYRNTGALGKQKTGLNYLSECNLRLDQFYTLKKARFLAEQKERIRITRESDQWQKQIDLFQYFNPKELPKAIDLYLTFLKDHDSFENRKKHFFQQFPILSIDDRKILLMLLINESARMWVGGNSTILKKALSLYKIGLEHHLLISNNQMTATTYANIITVAYLSKDFNFATDFKNKFTSFLPQGIQDDAMNWAEAYYAYHFHQTKDWKVLEIKLAQWRSGLNSFSIRAKVLLIQMRLDHFLETRNSDYYFLDFSLSFEKQIGRDRNFSKKRLQAIKRFIQYSRQLYKLLSSPDFELTNLSNLEIALKSKEDIRARDWLLAKIEVIKNPVNE